MKRSLTLFGLAAAIVALGAVAAPAAPVAVHAQPEQEHAAIFEIFTREA